MLKCDMVFTNNEWIELRKSKHTEEQIAFALKQVELGGYGGAWVVEVCPLKADSVHNL
jgi:hypothetical protein